MIKENISLKNHNSFGVEATARYYAEVRTAEEFITVYKAFTAQHSGADYPVLVLGGGSNILFTKDFPGLVIRMKLKGIREEDTGENTVLVTAQAGENWHHFVSYCLERQYGGLENLSLIPGNVGTSPVQNIGAYGVEIKDCFHACKVLDLSDFSVQLFTAEDCRFGYRDSIFKQEKGRHVILEVTFALTRTGHQLHLDYGAIREELAQMHITNPGIRDIAEAVIRIRRSKLPDPAETGNAGSFFKNPILKTEDYEVLKHQHPDMPGYGNGETVKVPAGWLIEQLGWKGRQIGNVAVHEKQALVIINKTGRAGGLEIYEFSQSVIDTVQDKFGIVLEREVNIL